MCILALFVIGEYITKRSVLSGFITCKWFVIAGPIQRLKYVRCSREGPENSLYPCVYNEILCFPRACVSKNSLYLSKYSEIRAMGVKVHF